MRVAAVGLVLLVCGTVAPVNAQYAEPNITFFSPLVTRRPVIEREFAFGLTHAKGQDARETEAIMALEVPILPRLQFEVEVPFLFLNPQCSRYGILEETPRCA